MPSKSVQIFGDGHAPAYVDETNNALVVQDEIHANIHRGIFFTACYLDESVADTDELDIAFTVVSPIHVRFSVAVGGNTTAKLHSGTTFTAETGTAIAANNRNMFSSNVSDIAIEADPTITVIGDEESCTLVPGGTKQSAVGSASASFEEWILPAGSYLLRLKNISGAAKPMSVALDFYQTNLA